MRSATALTSFSTSGPDFTSTFDARGLSRLPVGGAGQRRHIWDLPATYHCSVVGTCLSSAEVRRLLRKLGDPEADSASEHRLHGKAVAMAGRQDIAGKLLHKALDQAHDRFVRRFAKARSEAELTAAWREAADAGDIAGGYWAAMSHPLCSRDLAGGFFGEVHMLSHLIGRTNRADLKRLNALERVQTAQESRIAALEARVQGLTAEKVALAEDLQAARLDRRLAELRPAPAESAAEDAALWRQKHGDEAARAAALSERLSARDQQLAEAEARAAQAEARLRSMAADLAAAESACEALARPDRPGLDLDGRKVLYVGGRPKLHDQLRALADRSGGVLLSHDGGVEDALGLLPGLVSQADVVLFPVDCISHAAMSLTKRQSQEMGKAFLPLRSASLSSFVAALETAERPA